MDTQNKMKSSNQTNIKNWSLAEKIFSRSFYPLAIFISIPTYFHLVRNGFEAPIALLICLYPVIFLIIIFERIFPNKKEWNKSQGDIKADIAHNFLYYSVFAVAPVFTTLLVSALFWVTDPILSSQKLSIWPNQWPVLIQLLLALIAAEFIAYWIHRAHHTIPIMWRLHATHHSPKRLYWLNSGRFHLFNTLIDLLTVFIIMDILGISLKVFMGFLLFTAINGFFQHGNLKVLLGPLNWIVSGPELHRWHHSGNLKESSHNYGQTIILWDIIFGTRYLPKDIQQPSSTGIGYISHFPQSFILQQLSPFRWRKILSNKK